MKLIRFLKISVAIDRSFGKSSNEIYYYRYRNCLSLIAETSFHAFHLKKMKMKYSDSVDWNDYWNFEPRKIIVNCSRYDSDAEGSQNNFFHSSIWFRNRTKEKCTKRWKYEKTIDEQLVDSTEYGNWIVIKLAWHTCALIMGNFLIANRISLKKLNRIIRLPHANRTIGFLFFFYLSLHFDITS